MSLKTTVLETVIEYRMWNFQSPLILAVSGGRDSMVMLDILVSLTPAPAQNLIVTYVDHSSRDSSGSDAEFVEHQACTRGLPFIRETIEPWTSGSGVSAEHYWRHQRYSILGDIRKRLSATAVATAHTASDHLETMLMRLTAGTGPRGFLGIRPVRQDDVIRPMIHITRKEVTAYANGHHIRWLDDPGNTDLTKPRNRIRSSVIPVLEKINPEVAGASVRSSRLLALEDRELSRQAHELLSQAGWNEKAPAFLDVTPFKHASPAVVGRCAAAVYGAMSVTFRVTSDHVHRLSQCFRGESSFCPIPEGGQVRRESDRIIILPPVTDTLVRRIIFPESAIIQPLGAYVIIGEVVSRADQSLMTVSGVGIRIRTRRSGDRVVLDESNSLVSLSEFFRRKRVPVCIRDVLPLVVNGKGHVYWVADPVDVSRVVIRKAQAQWIKLTCTLRSAIKWSLNS